MGILIMVVSMAAFALADTLVKVASATISPAQVLFLLTCGAMLLFALMAKVQGESLNGVKAFSPILLVRYLSEVMGMGGMVLALTHVPLSTVGAITQATPIVVVLGAVLFFGEKISWRRWASIIAGFIGVLMIVQPGAVSFEFSVLWAVLAMVALSIRDLTTRLVPPEMGSASLATYTMMAAIPFAALWVLYNGESLFPAQANWLVVVPMILLGSVGYVMLIISLRMAKMSVVMPFRYTRIIFMIMLGVFVFGERPSVLMLLGAVLIIASGSYIMWREQRVKSKA